MDERRYELKSGAKLTLFLVSYIPLFLIMCFTQLYEYRDHLVWGGLSYEPLLNYIRYFGAVTVLVLMSFFGLVGLRFLLPNIKRRTKSNGILVKVIDIENKNSESISYLFTYIIPFVFQDLSSITNVFAVSVLLFVTYLIYSNSSMLLINPTISMVYSLYLIEYEDMSSKRKRKGMVLSRNKFLEEDDEIKIRSMGHKLYFAVEGETSDS